MALIVPYSDGEAPAGPPIDQLPETVLLEADLKELKAEHRVTTEGIPMPEDGKHLAVTGGRT